MRIFSFESDTVELDITASNRRNIDDVGCGCHKATRLFLLGMEQWQTSPPDSKGVSLPRGVSRLGRNYSKVAEHSWSHPNGRKDLDIADLKFDRRIRSSLQMHRTKPTGALSQLDLRSVKMAWRKSIHMDLNQNLCHVNKNSGSLTSKLLSRFNAHHCNG